MKLFDAQRAPNPRRVHIFLAEKNVELERVPIDIGKMEHKSPQFGALTAVQRLPALQLDDGTVIAESTAICRYVEELHPDPPLFGRGAKGKALVEMWHRHVEFYLAQPIFFAFRHIHPSMAQLETPQLADWGEANKSKAAEFMAILDGELKNREFIAGDDFSVADITALCVIDFGKVAKVRMPEELTHLKRWHAAVSARPSASAT